MVQARVRRLASSFAPVVLVSLCGVCCCPIAACAIDVEYETEFLAGLRSRGLYRLAAIHAESVLARDDVSDTARIELAIDFSRTLAEWGHASQPGEREERWQRAHAVLGDMLANVSTHPRAVLLELQDALLWLGEGDLAKEEAVLTAGEAATSAAREKLRTAIGKLQSLSERVDQALQRKRMTRPQAAEGDAFSMDELTSLSHNVALQTARALLSQAAVYPAESPDRINALSRAVDQLTSLLQRVGDNDLRRQAELELIAAHRLLGHFAEAQRLLSGVEATHQSSARAAAEEVRLLLAEGRPAEALAAAGRHRRQIETGSPELLLAHLEALVASGLASSDAGGQRQAVEAATTVLAELKREHPPRWHQRGELWLARLLAATNQQAGTVPMARLAAEGLYRAGRLDEAVAAFDRAVELAREQQDAEAAFDLAMTAAAVVQQRGDASEAARRYRELAENHASHPRAADAHRLAILATSDAARAASSPGERGELLAEYARLLEEHLATWPAATSTDEVRIWLARWRLQSGEPEAALRTLREVSPQSEHFEASRRLFLDTYERLVTSSQTDAEKAAVANQAAHDLQPVITGADNRWPAQWTALQRDVALVLARLQLAHVPGGVEYTKRLLHEALAAGPAPEVAWRQRAAGVLLAAQVVSGERAQVETLLAELAAAPPAVKADVAGLLTGLQAGLEPDARRAASELALRMLDGMQGAGGGAGGGAGESAPGDLARERARALAAAGRQAEALLAYRELVEQRPDDFEVHEEYGRLLAASDSAADKRLALRTYLQIERRTRPGGKRWTRARLARIELLAALGDRTRAEKLRKLTRAVHPELADQLVPSPGSTGE